MIPGVSHNRACTPILASTFSLSTKTPYHDCGCPHLYPSLISQQPIFVQITGLPQVSSETQATGDQLAVAADEVAALMAQLAAARAVVASNRQEAQGFRMTSAGAS